MPQSTISASISSTSKRRLSDFLTKATYWSMRSVVGASGLTSTNRIMEHRRDEVADALRHRCTEQEVLTALRQEREDPPDVPNEAHVEHPIGLIEHQVGQIGQIEMTLLLQIEQASGRGDEDVDALPEGLDLGHVPHATEDDEA